jgi:hypothetical protein
MRKKTIKKKLEIRIITTIVKKKKTNPTGVFTTH